MNFLKIKSLKDLKEAIKECKNYKNAIKLKCLDCVCYEYTEIKKCDLESCPLWQFRLGKNPYSNRGKKNKIEAEEEQKISSLSYTFWARMRRNDILYYSTHPSPKI